MHSDPTATGDAGSWCAAAYLSARCAVIAFGCTAGGGGIREAALDFCERWKDQAPAPMISAARTMLDTRARGDMLTVHENAHALEECAGVV